MDMGEKIVVITRVERLGVSAYGNPYFRLELEDGSFVRTSINSMLNYGIENSENLNRRVKVKVTKAGQVYDIKPAGPECYGTIWVCQCCMLAHANGECCDSEQHGGDGIEPLSVIDDGFHVALGMACEEHAEECQVNTAGEWPDDYECDCETNTFSQSQCDGCGSWVHGERHAMTLFKD